MNYLTARKIAVGTIAVYLLLCFATCATGCLTKRNLPRHNDKFPEESAKYFAKKFPVTDSFGELLIDTSSVYNEDYSTLIDSLTGVIDDLNTAWADEITFVTEETAASFEEHLASARKEIASLKAALTQLRAQYKPCIPDTIRATQVVYRTNNAAVEAATLRADREALTRARAEEDLQKWRATAKVRFWIIVSLSLLLLFVAGIVVGRALKKASSIA